jgi:hypothetical protein
MEIKNLLEITPEIEATAREIFKASEKLKKLIGSDNHYSIEVRLSGKDFINIFDRHEYSRDGLGKDYGFFLHKIFSDGKVLLDFVPEDTEEALKFDEEFEREFHAEDIE